MHHEIPVISRIREARESVIPTLRLAPVPGSLLNQLLTALLRFGTCVAQMYVGLDRFASWCNMTNGLQHGDTGDEILEKIDARQRFEETLASVASDVDGQGKEDEQTQQEQIEDLR